MFKKINNPILFQGSLKKKNYFEGWYYKIVNSGQNISLAFIPGVSINSKNTHAFIQVFITKKNNDLKTKYISYELSDFNFKNSPFIMSVGNSFFSEDHIEISIQEKDIFIEGKLNFSEMEKIKTSIFSPSIMGFFAFFKFMECYHGVISMRNKINGTLKIDDETIDFSDGVGYIEKDWGKSFPKEYVWMQCNHFKNKETSFMFSEAIIPFLGLSFHGLIVNLIYDLKEYRFATYNFAKVVKKDIKSNQVYYEIKKRKLKLVITAVNGKTTSLASPDNGAMVKTIKEGLSGIIRLVLYKNNVLIYQDEGTDAGLEIMMK